MTQQEIQANRTQGKWKKSFVSELRTSINSIDCQYKFIDSWSHPEDKFTHEANAAAIVSAVNGTWNKGYDPSQMDSLYKALKLSSDLLRKGIRPTKEQSDQIMEALNEAKLTPINKTISHE